MKNEDFILKMKILASNNIENNEEVQSHIYNGIMKHFNQIINGLTLEEFAKLCFSSKPTILKFCKKIGLTGYSELKYKLKAAIENNDSLHPELSIKKEFNNKTFQEEYFQTVNKYLEYLSIFFANNDNLINNIISEIKSANSIYIFATNLAYYSSKNFGNKLTWMKKIVIIENDINLMESFISQSSQDDLFILISMSGKNPNILNILNDISLRGNKIFGIFGPNNIPNNKFWNQIQIPQFEGNLWDNYSIRSQFLTYFFDILHVKIISNKE